MICCMMVKKKPTKNEPTFDLTQLSYQLTYGIDLTKVDGIGVGFLLNLIAEVGIDLSKFPTAKHFTSWLCLCPNKRISGNRVISSKTQKNKSRLAYAFRQAANAIGNQKEDTALSLFFRRLAFKQGRKVAIVGTARKLATIVYNMLQNGQDYEPLGSEEYQQLVRHNKLKNIQRTIQKLGIKPEELVFA